MLVYISPKHTNSTATNMNLDDKIEVFVERVEGWQFGVAKEMIDKGIFEREFALLHIVMSYFEMIAKYSEGYCKDDKSEKYFRKGVRVVFPDIDNLPADVYKDFFDFLYRNVRCGLYHAASPRQTLVVPDSTTLAPIRYHPRTGTIMINVDKLVHLLRGHFAEYATKLRDKANTYHSRNARRLC